MGDGVGFLDLGQPQVIFVVLLSLLLPLSIFVGRRNVRVRRLRMLDNLEDVLRHVPPDSGSFIPPALDLVRARYRSVRAPVPGAAFSTG